MRKQYIVTTLAVSLLLAAVCFASNAAADILLKAVGKNEISLRPKTMDSQIEIHGQIAQIKTTLTMASELDIQSEADFEYTVPDNTLVTYFAYWYKGEKVLARIVSKERAAEIYRIVSNTKVQHHRRWTNADPAIVEMTDKNTFHVRIFPIEANADLKVEIHSVQMLDADSKGSVFTFPLQASEKNKGTFEKIHINLRLYPGRLYPDGDVTTISNNYNLPLTQKEGVQTLDLQQQNWRAQQDLKVRFSRPVKALNADLYSARAGGANGFFALTIIPSQDISKPRLEIQGVKTWQLLPPKLAPMKKHVPVLITGRYAGSGAAKVLLHGYGEKGVLAASNNVEFSAKQIQPNPAAQFWAKLQMQQLAKNAKNKSAVMELSKRFNLPSKYTSWLALPEEGRKIYEKNLANRKLEDYGQKLANLIVEQKGKSASARRLRKLIDEQSKIAETNPDDAVARYLAWQIENVASDIVRAKEKEKTSVKYVQQKQNYLNMLLSYIPTHTNRYIKSRVSEIAETDYRNAVSLYVSKVQEGQKDTASSHALLGHIQRFYAKHYSKEEDNFSEPKDAILNEADSNAWQLVQAVSREKIKSNPDEHKLQQWSVQLQRLVEETGISTDSIFKQTNKSTFQGRVRSLVEKPTDVGTWDYAKKISDAEAEIPEIGRKLGIDKEEQQTLFKNTLFEDVQQLVRKYYSQQYDSRQNPTELKQQHDQLIQIANAMHVPYDDLVDSQAKPWARQQLYRLPDEILNEEAKENPDQAKLKLLKSQLDQATYILQYKATHFSKTWEQDFANNYYSDKTAEDYLKEARFNRVSSKIETSNRELAVEKSLRHPDEKHIEELNQFIDERIKNFPPDTQARLRKEMGHPPVLWTVRDLLFREYRKEKPDAERAAELKNKLIELEKTDWYLSESATRYARARKITNPTLYGNLRAQRLELSANREKLEDKIKTEKDATQVADLNQQRAKIMAQQKKLIARMGDPLISVQAPNAISVVALMPDGETKQLVYDAQKYRWEARFDIPASAAEGKYTIQIIVVHKDGSRQMLQMHYSVDLTPPAGKAQMQVVDKNYSGQKVVRLEVQTDENAARASALLPWNQKVELMPSENTPNQFFALTPVPDEFDKSTFTVTFVLTDKAHNRAEITVTDVVRE